MELQAEMELYWLIEMVGVPVCEAEIRNGCLLPWSRRAFDSNSFTSRALAFG